MSRRVIDCTKVLRHGAANSFTAHEFERAGEPRTLVHRIEMDADVGTHVLAPRRYARWGSDLADLAPETFFGEGLVAHIEVTADAPDIDSNRLEDVFGRNLRSRDIVVIAARGDDVTPCFTAQAAQWLFVRGAKLVALADGVCVGREQEPDDERVILGTLLETDVPIVRGLVNTEQLSTERMAFMALPAAAENVTAWPVRFIALDPGLDPTAEASAEDADADQPEDTDEPAEPESTDAAAGDQPEETQEPTESEAPATATPKPDEPASEPAPEAAAEDDQPPDAAAADQPEETQESTDSEAPATATPEPDEPSEEAAPEVAAEDDQPPDAEPADQEDSKDSDQTDASQRSAEA